MALAASMPEKFLEFTARQAGVLLLATFTAPVNSCAGDGIDFRRNGV
jgi:hypothetical protein